jgi:hypothetical protein
MTTTARRKTTINKLALTAAATAAAAIALSATSHADPDYQPFQSPSGNIHCEMTVNYKGTPYANCTVQHATYAGQLCQEPGLVIPQFGIDPGIPAHMPGCVGTNGGWAVLPTLDYGDTRSVGPIVCDSEPAGVTCTDTSTGHFFRVSQDSYQLGG